MKTILATFLTMLAIVGLWVWVATDGGKSVASASGPAPKVLDPLREFFEIRDLTDRPLSCIVLAKRTPFVQVERERDHARFIVALNSLAAGSRATLEAIPDFNIPNLNEGLFNLAKTSTLAEVFYIHEVCYAPVANGGYVKTADGVHLEAFRGILKTLGMKYQDTVLRIKTEGGEETVFPPGIDQHPCVRIGDVVVHERDLEQIKTAVVDNYLRVNAVPPAGP